MKIAFIHHKSNVPDEHFFWSGWRTAFHDHQVTEFDAITYENFRKADSDEFDLVFVSPGFVQYERDLYRRQSKRAKWVVVLEEDAHHSLEVLRVVASYYDYINIYSEWNYEALLRQGVKNVILTLGVVNTQIYKDLLNSSPRYDAIFLGNPDWRISIQGATRLEYLLALEHDKELVSFIGRGFYTDEANVLYNDSKFGLEFSTTTVVGVRLFVGLSAAILMPRMIYPKIWLDTFTPNQDFLEFEGGILGMLAKLKEWKNRDSDRAIMIQRMREKILAFCTYDARFREILTRVFK